MMPGVTAFPARRPLVTAAWLAALAMAGFAGARLLGVSDRLGRAFALESLTLWLLLPAWLVLATALVARRWALVGVATVLVLAQLVWVGPDVRWWPREHRTGRGPTVRLVSANTVVGPDGRATSVVRRG